MGLITFRVCYTAGASPTVEPYGADFAAAQARALDVSQMTDAAGDTLKAYLVRSAAPDGAEAAPVDTGHTVYFAGAVLSAEGVAQ
jgi:hypothetical protein